MALTKETVVDKIEVLEMGQVQVRTATKVLEDGKELSRSYHRRVLSPDNDVSGESSEIKNIVSAVWTDTVKTAWAAKQAADAA